MSKITKLSIFTVFLFVSGWIYVKYYQPEEIKPVAETGNVIEINMRSLKDRWEFCVETGNPENPCEVRPITVKLGDRVKIHIFNEDSFDHGWAMEVFGINRRLFPKKETLVEFIASKEGRFQFYCSVPCGEGHYQQTGTLIIER